MLSLKYLKYLLLVTLLYLKYIFAIIIIIFRFVYTSISRRFLTGVQAIANLFKSPQEFRTLLCILTDFRNPIICMASTCLLISMSSHSFINPLVIVPSTPYIISINVTSNLNNNNNNNNKVCYY